MRMIILYTIIIALGAEIASCKDEKPEPEEIDSTVSVIDPSEVEIRRSLTDQTIYASGDLVRINSFEIVNQSIAEVKLDSIWIEVGRASNNGNQIAYSVSLGADEVLPAGDSVTVSDIVFDTEGFADGSYLVHLGVKIASTDTTEGWLGEKRSYITFFRVAHDESKLSYFIDQELLNGLPVYKLYGGLSAEYAVEKSVANLNRGISHSWIDINPPRQSSANFLQRAIGQTMSFYERELGKDSPIKRVIISTGITPVSYISRVMDAPVLPLHYLVGASTTKEIQTILDHASSIGLPAYATFGHDYSLSTSQGVAWIKLLDLPDEYKQFIMDHQVEEVVFFGATSSGGGEKAARQLMNGAGHETPGSIYLMYFAGAEAEGYLRQVIKDFDGSLLGNLITIADWESGIIQKQVDSMSGKIKVETGVQNQVLVTAKGDDIHLWDMASYTILKFYQVNGIQPTGISLNPYLAGHPFYESYFGIVPFTYFNHSGFPLSVHTERIDGMLADAFLRYFPSIYITDMNVYANTGTRSDFFTWFQAEGYASVVNVPYRDVWNLNDGDETPSESRARQLLEEASADELKSWGGGLIYLSIQDLRDIASYFGQITVTDQ